MKVATWNVNSVRVRREQLLSWLEVQRPDVLCLQELKCAEDAFPSGDIESLGYHSCVFAEKTYNGVAIISSTEPTDVWKGLSDGKARVIGAKCSGVDVISAYFPNGGSVDSDKYPYKLSWMAELADVLKSRFDLQKDEVALCGDYNVAPFDDDIARLEEFKGGVLTSQKVRDALSAIAAVGLHDTFRPFHPDGGVYSWWDYRGRGFERGNGLRIDHIFASRPLADSAIGAIVDREQRKAANPSDHAPVIVEFDR